jgi:hypothetical protein
MRRQFNTTSGYKIVVTPVGFEFDVHTLNLRGGSISTVRMTELELRDLLDSADALLTKES